MKLGWKPLFYEGLLPALARLSPESADAALSGLGRALTFWPPHRRDLARAVSKLREILNHPWNDDEITRKIAEGRVRYLCRDYLLDGLDPTEFERQFHVTGADLLDQTANTGQGLVLVGAHFGAHLAAVHWLYRRGIPLRLLVQRPRHISRYLSKEFDRADTHNPQADLFVKRHLPPRESAARVVRAWRALRDGMAVYFNSDIPWPIASARPGRFLGLGQRFLALWADLAALAQAPVLAVFCSYRPGGGFDLSFEGPWRVRPGAENHALQQFLDRLEARIITHPEQAVPYLFWPNYAVQRALKGDPPGVPSRTPNRAHSPRGLISKPVGSEAPTRTP